MGFPEPKGGPAGLYYKWARSFFQRFFLIIIALFMLAADFGVILFFLLHNFVVDVQGIKFTTCG